MTTETRKRIRAYKKMLPELRERVIAVALLLAMSASMLGSASFAWITLSRAPEVSGMSTTVAANGNLEIALARGRKADGKIAPLESQVGDSSSTERENWGIMQANATWGNLVNLSDPKYGLDQIALRPALLSTYGLDESPLHGATYGLDGRVVDTIEPYEYASLMDIGGGETKFTAGDTVEYGVRAVSSMITENTVGGNRIAEFERKTNGYYGSAMSRYQALVSDGRSGSATPTKFNGKSAVSALQGLVTDFAKEKVLSSDISYAGHVWYLHQMMIELRDIMLKEEALGLLELANWQAYIWNKNTNDRTFDTFDQLLEHKDELSDVGVTLTTLNSFLNDLNILNECISDMQSLADSCDPTSSTATNPKVTWDELATHVNKMVDLSTATLEAPNKGVKETLVYNLGSDKSDALNLLGEDQAIIRVKKGVIFNFEDRHSDRNNRMNAYVKISILGMSIAGHVITTADDTPNYIADIQRTIELDNSGAAGQKYAKDTYGMAIDVWVRTNAPESILTLEGTTEYKYEDVTFKDSENRTITVYELAVMKGEFAEIYEIYQNPDDKKWYYYTGNGEVPEADLNAGSKSPKQTKKVIGFRGENRIWEDWETLLDNGYIAENAITQGAGSCFIFYADNPAEQSKLLEMMHAFTITFINVNGDALATAVLDVENAYINQGKITAPLVIESGVSYMDEEDKQQKGIMALPQNEATWLTALIYLNGDLLHNDNVLANSSIVGQLNLQFGNTTQMEVREDENLQMQHRTITAEAVAVADPSKVSTNIEDVIEYEYDVNGHDVKVDLTVDGDQPERIEGFFVRVINETQGTRADTVNFTENGNGTWSGIFKLTAPGTYVMNSLMVDGVEYSLRAKTQMDKGNHPSVVINGLRLDNVRTTHLAGTYRTDADSIQVGVYAKIDADPALTPKTVWAQFFSEDGKKQYNGQLKFNPNNDGGTWEGTVSLNSSGIYYLRYLTIDGEAVEVPASSQKRLNCYMGLYCIISCAEERREFLYEGTAFNLDMNAYIYDDNNELLTDLEGEGVHLYYHMDGSSDDDQGMHAPMTWDDTDRCYTTTFNLNAPGIYSFNRLEIGSSTLNSARTSPEFMASTPVPPAWVDGSASVEARRLVLNAGDAVPLYLSLTDASAASVWAEIVNTEQNDDGSYTSIVVPFSQRNNKTGAGEAETIDENANESEFTFTLQDAGKWRLNRVFCQGVYNGTTAYPVVSDPNKTGYKGPASAANSYVINVPAEEQVVTEIVTIVAEVYYNDDDPLSGTPTYHFGGELQSDGVTYKGKDPIFTAYTPSIDVKITDYKGEPVPELKELNWYVQHSNSLMNSYGGYTGDAMNGGMAVANKLSLKSGETVIYASPAVTMDLAGQYTTYVEATFDGIGTPYRLSAQPKFKVYSVTPTVAITGINKAGKFDVDKTDKCEMDTKGWFSGWSNNNTHATSDISAEYTATTATVCFYCTTSEQTAIGLGARTHNYSNRPWVKIDMTGVGNAKAELNFGTDVHIYNYDDLSKTNGFAWTADGTCQRYIGYYQDRENNTDVKTTAGTLTATEITLTAPNGKTYKVDLGNKDIVIKNPY